MTVKSLISAVIVCAILNTCASVHAQDKPVASKPKEPTVRPSAVKLEPKPIGENVKKGLAWLIKMQQPDGGWGQGDESAHMGAGAEMRGVANVTDTCMAAMALMRAGSTPKSGPHASNLAKAVEFVCKEIEASDTDSIFITNIRNTRVQAKLGVTIDTFSATLLLAEVKDSMPDDASRKRVADALAKTMRKIEKNQNKDGTWSKDGWAAVLCQGMASKALNVAAQNGVAVDEKVRENAETFARTQFEGGKAGFKADGSAGVQLYAASSSVGGMRQSDNTNRQLEKDLRDKLASPATTQPAKEAIQVKLRTFEENRKQLADAEAAVVAKMNDPQFVAGFGSNGGEEFLSHLSIGESLMLSGGQEWTKWDKSMTQNMNRIQNEDGSWTGHHCITGRTFCTSTALLVLMVDRTPAPISQTIRKQ